jgi:hypothetical protein
MQYVQPYGVSDPNAPYINGNPATGVQGSIPPAEAFEDPQRELVALITGAALSPDANNLTQVFAAVQYIIQRQQPCFGLDTGTVNALIMTLTPPATKYINGMPVRIYTATANTGPTTLDVNDLGPVPVVNLAGAPLQPNDMIAGQIFELCYINGVFQLLRPPAAAGSQGPPGAAGTPGAPGPSLRGFAAWTNAGNYNWTVPADVYSVFAEVTGAGGGGGSVAHNDLTGACGGGGGVAEGFIAVSPGQVIPLTVGYGGRGATAAGGGFGSDGGASAFASFSGGGGGGGAGTGSSAMTGGGSGFGSGGQYNWGKGRGGAGTYAGVAYGASFSGGKGGGEGGGPCGQGSGNPGWPGSKPGAGGGGTGLAQIGSFGGNGADGSVILKW